MTIDITDYEQWIASPFTQAFLNSFVENSANIIKQISHTPGYNLPDILDSYTQRGKLFVFEKLETLFKDEQYCLEMVKEIFGE